MTTDHHVGTSTTATDRTPGTELTDHLLARNWWTDDIVAAAGLSVEDVAVATVGGGIGSFVLVDYLRVAGGLPPEGIRVLSNIASPWHTYERLTRASQMPRSERIRSDAASCPDNLWGFPSYAVREAFRERRAGPLLRVLVEPVLADYYTPRLGDVLDSIEREAARIRYWDMLVLGDVQLVRRRVGGGYYVVAADRGTAGLRVFRCRDVHLAPGYAGIGLQPDLQGLRLANPDRSRAVHAYEDHEHVYASLQRRPGTVVVRGGGIVASRVLERLLTDRSPKGQLTTRVLHILRTYVEDDHGPHPWSRRKGRDGFAYQGFNYPKSAWGGQLKARMRRLEGERRALLYDRIGGTTTAYRRTWQRELALARREGRYHSQPGTIQSLRQETDGLSLVLVGPGGPSEVSADYLIDCTGLNANVRDHAVLRDLLDHGGAGANPLGRIDVERHFEVRGTRSGDGRLYLSGAAALGGYFPGVDTFLGLQIAAQEIVGDMAARGHCRKLTPAGSIAAWASWMTGRRI